jgi:esterase/lipase
MRNNRTESDGGGAKAFPVFKGDGMKKTLIFIIVFTFLACLSCAPKKGEPAPSPLPSEQAAETPAESPAVLPYTEEDIFYPSRGIEVPARVVIPEGKAGEAAPLAVILHGHGGTNEGLRHIARALAELGIASIHPDFPGCGRSRESFRENNLANMKEDALAAIAYMESNYGTDPNLVGLVGYSMGGRISLELTAEGAVKPYAMLLIAPAASTKELINLFGGQRKWDSMKREAEEEGFARYYITSDYYQELGAEFFSAIERVSDPSEDAAANFEGAACVVCSTDDYIVPWSVSKSVAKALGCETLEFSSEGHGYGLYGPADGELLSSVIEAAKRVFSK